MGRIEESLGLYTKMRRVPSDAPYLAKLEILQTEIGLFRKNMRDIIIKIISVTPGMRMFLLTHSVFDANLLDPGIDEDGNRKQFNTFGMMMSDILDPSDDEIVDFMTVPKIGSDLMKALAVFEPEVLGYEVECSRVEYHIYGSRHPMELIDNDWDRIDRVESDRIKAMVSTAMDFDKVEYIDTFQPQDELPF